MGELQMFRRIAAWLNSFVGALVMGVLSFFSLLGELGPEGSDGWAWLYGVLTCWWLYLAYKAKNRDPIEHGELTVDQKVRIREATQAFHAVLKEIDDEMKAEHVAQVLKDKEKKDDGTT
jgi:hypothetical protein